MNETKNPLAYYASIQVEDVLINLKTSVTGLSSKEAKNRLNTFGKNILNGERKRNTVLEFLSNFANPLILILLFAAVLSFLLGQIIDGSIITIIILLSGILNFVQEHRANEAARKLRERVTTRATVFRSGKKLDIPVENLTIGDIFLLSSGDLVPADARIISSKDFFINESSLTGESFPVEKNSLRVDKETFSLPEMRDIVFLGTNVVSGSAKAVAVKIGRETEFGKIARGLAAEPVENEFTRGVRRFSYLILQITILFVIFIFIVNSLLKGISLLQSFTFAIAVAVGITPELLPIIMSITIGRGSVNMAEKGIIVKKLSAIPTFGSMDILCTDKTGTLTKEKIELVRYTNVFGDESEKVFLYAYLNSYFQTGIKNPLDEAILNFKKIEIPGYVKIDEVPFDFLRRKMSVVVEDNKDRIVITKGAPEEILRSSTYYYSDGRIAPLTEKAVVEINKQYFDFSREGYRVLAVAVKNDIHKKQVYSINDEIDLAFIGFVAFLDPPKAGVRNVVRDLISLGIKIKIITGDNELVTRKIAREVNLEVKGVMLGSEMDTMTDDALVIAAENTTIFARFSPDEKNRVIRALQQANHVVGYMGDGINDAPSINTADIGISVNNAVDVAKEAADVILTQKSLKVLENGIIEGRKTFGNTMKYIMMGTSSNFGNIFSVLGAILYLPFLPMLPIQILLNNFLYDLSQLTLTQDKVDEEFIRSPKRWNVDFIRRFMLTFGPISSAFDFITFFILFGVLKTTSGLFQTGWFLQSLATQTLVIHVIRTRRIPFIESKPSRLLIFSTFLVVIVGWVIPYTPLGTIFGFTRPPVQILLILATIVVAYLITVQLVKRLFYERYNF